MKQVLAAAIALVVGLVLGGLGPRAQVRALGDRVEELEARDCSGGGGGLGAGLASMFGDRPLMPTAPPPTFDEPAGDLEPTADAPEDGVRIQIGDAPVPVDAPEVPTVEMMKDALDLRRVQAQQALFEQADPSDEQLEEFDASIEEMNASLQALAEELVHRVESGAPIERRDSMVFAADALDIMIGAEDAIYETFDEDQLAGVDDAAVDPFSYVDGDILETLSSLDGFPEP